MDVLHYARRGFDIIRLSGDAIREISHDENAFGPGLLFALVAGLALAVGRYLVSPLPFLHLLIAPLGFLILFTAGIFLVHTLALLFGGTGSLVSLYRTAAVGSLLGWVMVVPKLGWVVMLVWYSVMMYRMLPVTHGLDWGRSLRAVMLAGGIVLVFYLSVLGLQVCAVEWQVLGPFQPGRAPAPAPAAP